MRALVFAYHDVGCACLEVLLRGGVEVAAVVTHEDDPFEEVWFGSVAESARRRGLDVTTRADVRSPAFLAWARGLRPDILFSFYYRRLLPAPLLDLPPRGALNLHGSLLPRYRGRCPVNWVLVNGESETGVTLHYMVPEADAGDIVGQKRIPIGPDDTARELFDRVTAASAALLEELLPALASGTAPRIPQDPSRATVYGGRRPEDGRIDWTRGAREIHNLVRAVTHPYPGAFTFLHGRRFWVWRSRVRRESGTAGPPGRVVSADPLVVAAGRGALEIVRAQIQGEPEADAGALARGLRLAPGIRFGDPAEQPRGEPA